MDLWLLFCVVPLLHCARGLDEDFVLPKKRVNGARLYRNPVGCNGLKRTFTSQVPAPANVPAAAAPAVAPSAPSVPSAVMPAAAQTPPVFQPQFAPPQAPNNFGAPNTLANSAPGPTSSGPTAPNTPASASPSKPTAPASQTSSSPAPSRAEGAASPSSATSAASQTVLDTSPEELARLIAEQERAYPLEECYTNDDLYMCCNAELEQLMDRVLADLKTDEGADYNPCNTNRVAQLVSAAAEQRFGATFEVVVGGGDYVSKSRFFQDEYCKIRRDGKFILAYGTPIDDDRSDSYGEPSPYGTENLTTTGSDTGYGPSATTTSGYGENSAYNSVTKTTSGTRKPGFRPAGQKKRPFRPMMVSGQTAAAFKKVHLGHSGPPKDSVFDGSGQKRRVVSEYAGQWRPGTVVRPRDLRRRKRLRAIRRLVLSQQG